MSEDMSTLRAELEQALDDLAEAKAVLNYVFYARLPMGEKVEEHIPANWWNRAVTAIEDKPNR